MAAQGVLLALALLVAGPVALVSADLPYFHSEDSTATFYGGANAAGTMGGACGYGNLYNTGYGTSTAAASIAMWNSGAICGSCWLVECINAKVCIPGAKVLVTVTNQCPQGSEGGWCDNPKHHLDMAYPSWKRIASDPMAGVVPTRMKRVPCHRRGGVSFTIAGNPFWIQMLVFNVAGPGDLSLVETSTDGGSTWVAFHRNWGSVWSANVCLQGKSVWVRLTGGLLKQRIKIANAIPSNWSFGSSYYTTRNFVTRGKHRRRAMEFAGDAALGPWIYANATSSEARRKLDGAGAK